MLRHFLFAALPFTFLVLLVLLAFLEVENLALVYASLVLVWLLCAGYVAYGGYVRVTVDGESVTVYRPAEGEVSIPRAAFCFSSNVETHSVNFIPISVERSLVAVNGAESFALLLPNIGKGDFDRLIAMLRQAGLKTGHQEPMAPDRAVFSVPKAAMLADFRRLIAIFAAGGVALSAVFVWFMQYTVGSGGPEARANFNIWHMIGFCALMCFLFALPVGMEYRKRSRRIPETITVDGEALAMEDDHIPLAEIRRITATPPDYGEGNFALFRTLTVQTDREKKKYNLGVRSPKGIWKAVFTEYELFCDALEAAAVANGVEFVYDL